MLPRPIITSLTTLIFLIVAATGVLIFFHLGGAPAKLLHEWLGLGFALVALVHLAQNWRPLMRHLKRRLVYAPLLIVALGSAGALIYLAAQDARPGHVMMLRSVAASPLSEVAPLLDVTPEALLERLEARGINAEGPQQRVKDIAAANDLSLPAVLGALYPRGAASGAR